MIKIRTRSKEFLFILFCSCCYVDGLDIIAINIHQLFHLLVFEFVKGNGKKEFFFGMFYRIQFLLWECYIRYNFRCLFSHGTVWNLWIIRWLEFSICIYLQFHFTQNTSYRIRSYVRFASPKDYKSFVYFIETEISIFFTTITKKNHMRCLVQCIRPTRQREIEFLLFLNKISFSCKIRYFPWTNSCYVCIHLCASSLYYLIENEDKR